MIQILEVSVRGFKVFKAVIRINLHEVKVNTLVKDGKHVPPKEVNIIKKKKKKEPNEKYRTEK